MIKRVDENGNVRLITNIRKPRKWRRYEYLESSGTLYIDTGISYDSTDSTYIIECKFSLPSNVSSYDAIFGAYTNEKSKTLRIIRGDNNSIMWSYYNTKAGGGVCGRIETANSNIREVILTSTETIVTENGTTTTYTHPAVNGNNTISRFYLFCQGTSDGSVSCLSKSIIYYFRLYDNNTLIKDFVPAQYNGQYGMWDLVEDKFYPNKGTGSFTVGPEVKNYDEIYEVKKAYSTLPSGVELYDYILSSGTLYIDSGWITNYTKSFEITSKYNASSSGSRGCILSAHNAARAISLEITGSSRFYLYAGNIDNRITANVGVDHISTFSYGGGIWKHQVDNETALTGSASYSDSAAGSAYIFLDRALRTTTFNKLFKIYYLTIKEDGVLIRNFLPCTYLGEPGMWDTVENKFYRNQGTGLFTLGNKITLKEYEYLQGDGVSCYIDTGVYPNNNTHIKTSVLVSTVGNGTFAIYGAGGTSYTDRTFELYDWSNLLLFNYGSGTNYLVYPPLNTWLEVEHNKNQVRCNITTGTITSSTFNSPTTMFIFSTHRSNGTTFGNKSNIKMQYFMLWDNNILIRDFIPVSYNGTPGLWDKVEWKFYANAGSGSFTLGPEKASGTYPISYLYDRTVYEEPDGSKWLRIAHHNNPNTRRFTNSDSFTTYVHTNEHLFFDVSWCNTFTLWELMIKLKTTSSAVELKFRWVLNYNPMTATFANVARSNVTYNISSGYTTPIAELGGLHYNGKKSYLICNNGDSSNWFGNIGGWTLYLHGIPGWNNEAVTTGYIDLYIRIA